MPQMEIKKSSLPVRQIFPFTPGRACPEIVEGSKGSWANEIAEVIADDETAGQRRFRSSLMIPMGLRRRRYVSLLDQTITLLAAGQNVEESDLVKLAGLDGKIVTGSSVASPKKFSNDAKSQVFIQSALASSVKCPICNGYLDTVKSVSYDHVQRAQDGGSANAKNLQLTHPYCNQSVKN